MTMSRQSLINLSIFYISMAIGVVIGSVILRIAFTTFSNLDYSTQPREIKTQIVDLSKAATSHSVTAKGLLYEARKIQSDILFQKAEEIMQSSAEPEPALTGSALYASYADQIVELYYPELDAKYIKAIIWHESRYDPTAINSSSGCMGLMQISPKWHSSRAEQLGCFNLLDPYGNIMTGCDLLSELTQKYDFNYAMNFFAGGYPYANRYKNSTSPYIESLNRIIAQMEDGTITLGGD